MTRYRLVTAAGAVVEDQEFEGSGLDGAIVEGRMRAIRHGLRLSRVWSGDLGAYVLERLDAGSWTSEGRLNQPAR